MKERKWKKVVFYEEEQNSANLKIRLKYDRLTQGNFFRSIIKAYIQHDPRLVELVAEIKTEHSTMGQKNINLTKREILQGSNLMKKLHLTEKEKEDIFDLISVSDLDMAED